ncbi:phosphatase PAP2 family protein [Asanoa sp. NPDC050611]|uniref:phosphatase PAP2 family protein n=1 Tax=Asanoa sp. NPDC050611 TaxID=3157098 RepID=UPI0033CEE8B2
MNYALFQSINSLAGRIDAVDDPIEFAAIWLIAVLFAVAAVRVAWALRRRQHRQVAEIAATLALAFLLGVAVAGLGLEQRPFQSHHVHQLIPHGPGTSLPSDHATAAFAVALAVGWFLDRRLGALLLVGATVIGLARIWVGVHYPADVLASLVIAAAAVAVVALAGRLVRIRRAVERP